MKRLLAIETSSEACSVALADGSAIHEQHTHAPLKHAELLLASVRTLLREAGWGLGELEAIAFGRGPGSFTSLRIGISAVQGLAWGAGLPVVPVSSLASIAVQVAEPGVREIIVAVDARMDEVFNARFASHGGCSAAQPLGAEQVCDPGQVLFGQPAESAGCGNAFERYPALRQLAADFAVVRPDLTPRASALIPLAREWLKDHDPLPAREAQPVYVRNHVANKPEK